MVRLVIIAVLLMAQSVVSAGTGRGAESTVTNSLRVGTYNVRTNRATTDKGTPNDWESRKTDLVEFIKKINFDVFGMQEMTPVQAQYFRDALPEWDFWGDHLGEYHLSGEATPVFFRRSRFDVVDKDVFWLSETPDVPGSRSWGSPYVRSCAYVVLRDRASGVKFCFANTHLNMKTGVKEVGVVIDRLKGLLTEMPVVFTGDHNCFETDEQEKIISKFLKNAFYLSESEPQGPWRSGNDFKWKDDEILAAEAIQYPIELRNVLPWAKDIPLVKGKHPYEVFGARYDYIYVSPGVRVSAYGTVNRARPGMKTYPSDHYPLVATIYLPRRAK